MRLTDFLNNVDYTVTLSDGTIVNGTHLGYKRITTHIEEILEEYPEAITLYLGDPSQPLFTAVLRQSVQ